jgi:hypothetical protein
MNQPEKYGILPPLRTICAGPGMPVAIAVITGYSEVEWQANLPQALEELLATFSPQERGDIKAEMRQAGKARRLALLPRHSRRAEKRLLRWSKKQGK